MLLLKQTIPLQKALDLSFNLTPLKWAWLYQEGTKPSRRKKHRSARSKKSYSRAGGRGSLMIMPHPLSGCQIKAEIKDFLLKYRLFLFLYVPFCSVQALVPSKFWTQRFTGIHFYTLYLNLCVNNIENCHLQSLCSRYLVHTKNDTSEAMEDLKIWKGEGQANFYIP